MMKNFVEIALLLLAAAVSPTIGATRARRNLRNLNSDKNVYNHNNGQFHYHGDQGDHGDHGDNDDDDEDDDDDDNDDEDCDDDGKTTPPPTMSLGTDYPTITPMPMLFSDGPSAAPSLLPSSHNFPGFGSDRPSAIPSLEPSYYNSIPYGSSDSPSKLPSATPSSSSSSSTQKVVICENFPCPTNPEKVLFCRVQTTGKAKNICIHADVAFSFLEYGYCGPCSF